jgi:hypothetical protein
VNAMATRPPYDDRMSYNPPPVTDPAMDDAQFWYDEQRQILESVIANPSMMAHIVMDLRERVTELENGHVGTTKRARGSKRGS